MGSTPWDGSPPPWLSTWLSKCLWGRIAANAHVSFLERRHTGPLRETTEDALVHETLDFLAWVAARSRRMVGRRTWRAYTITR